MQIIYMAVKEMWSLTKQYMEGDMKFILLQ